jgi:hypothetical protein
VLRPAQGVNLCGIVIDVNPVRQTRTGEWALLWTAGWWSSCAETLPRPIGDSTVSLVVTDPSNYKGTGDAENFVLTVFRAKEAELPLNVVPGTPILVRDVRVSVDPRRSKARGPSGPG